MRTKILIHGEFDPTREPHAATGASIEHAAQNIGGHIDFSWIPTDEIDCELLITSNEIFIAHGSPYRDMGKVLSAIKVAREKGHFTSKSEVDSRTSASPNPWFCRSCCEKCWAVHLRGTSA